MKTEIMQNQDITVSFSNVHLLDHPIIQSKLAQLRNKKTGTCEYRRVLGEIGAIIGYEASRDMRMCLSTVETDISSASVKVLAEDIVLIPLMRGGLAMVSAMMLQFSGAHVHHLGLRQNTETQSWEAFFCKLPADLSQRYIFVLEPLLITGEKLSMAVDFLKNHGAERIKCICIVGTPDGVRKFCTDHPDVELYLVALDRQVDDAGRMIPGIGDTENRVLGRWNRNNLNE